MTTPLTLPSLPSLSSLTSNEQTGFGNESGSASTPVSDIQAQPTGGTAVPTTGGTSQPTATNTSCNAFSILNPFSTASIAGCVAGKTSSTVTNLGSGFSWGRVAAFIGGFLMIGAGLYMLTGGGSKSVVNVIDKAKSAGEEAAEAA